MTEVLTVEDGFATFITILVIIIAISLGIGTASPAHTPITHYSPWMRVTIIHTSHLKMSEK
jgi:hypothetical protein